MPPLRVIPKQVRDDDILDAPRNFPLVMLNLFQHEAMPPLRVIPKQVRDDDILDAPCNFPLVMLNLFQHKGHGFEILTDSQNDDGGTNNMYFCGIMMQLALWMAAVPSLMCTLLKAGS
jgi:hypothetical protein